MKDYSEIPGDYGLQMASAGKLHAIAAPVVGGINIKDQALVVQFEVINPNWLRSVSFVCKRSMISAPCHSFDCSEWLGLS